ncbi:hypothetical protein [Marinobacterium aestuariivivens]|uniref:Uncharacterized protein n=1 Tax=Marinobacterium aestuariivivens TaxID=1698799 RepID=A0ABW2A1C1_9GAMM
MGYLADIVADARDRRGTGLNPTCFEDAVELTVPGGSDTANSGTEAGNTVAPSQLPPEHAATIEPDDGEPKSFDVQPAREHVAAAKPAKGAAGSDGPASTQPTLHEHLLRLSQQTLVERSERILMQRRQPGAPAGADIGDTPASAQSPETTARGLDPQASPAAEAAAGKRAEVSVKAAARPVPEQGISQHRSVSYTEIRESRQQNGPMPREGREGREPLQRQLSHPVAQHGVTERPPPSPVSTAATWLREPAGPSRRSPSPQSAAPQLRIEQINVVVESTRPDKERRGGLERDPDPGSRYFLRSL